MDDVGGRLLIGSEIDFGVAFLPWNRTSSTLESVSELEWKEAFEIVGGGMLVETVAEGVASTKKGSGGDFPEVPGVSVATKNSLTVVVGDATKKSEVVEGILRRSLVLSGKRAS